MPSSIERDEVGEILRLLRARAALVLAFIDVLAVLEELGRGAVERQHDVLARGVAGLADRGHDEVQRSIRRRQVRREAAFVADIGVVAGLLELALQRVEDLRAAAQRFGKARRAHRHDHEFLEVDRVVGVDAAIDDVHHRHRQGAGRGAADIAIQRQVVRDRGGLGAGERDAENGVGADPALVLGAVELDQDLVDLDLVLHRHVAQGFVDLVIDGLDRLQHALAEIAVLVAVAQLDRLVGAGGGAGRNCGAADRAVLQHDVDLDRGIAAAVQDFAADDVDDGGHEVLLTSSGWALLRRFYRRDGRPKRPSRAEGGQKSRPNRALGG